MTQGNPERGQHSWRRSGFYYFYFTPVCPARCIEGNKT